MDGLFNSFTRLLCNEIEMNTEEIQVAKERDYFQNYKETKPFVDRMG